MRNEDVLKKTSGIGFKEKFGYALGDAANVFVFGLVGSLLQKYYTDMLLIPATAITVLFLVARLWDAINDPIWGRIVDTLKPTKDGRYKKWLARLAVPLGVSAVLMFVKIPNLTPNQYLIYAYFTYILFGMLYTGTNIPYGSMASVITTDEKERSALSIFRSVGSALGGLPSMLLASLVFVTVTINGEETKQMDYTRLIVGVSIISFMSIVAYFLSYKWTKERVIPPPKPKPPKGESLRIIKQLLTNRPFMVLCFSSMLLIAAQMFMQSFYLYLFDDYFLSPELYVLVTVCTYLPMGILMFFTSKLVERFGKKEVCAMGMLLSAVSNFILFFLKTQNPYVFIALTFVTGTGAAFFVLLVWALVTDVIDYEQCRTGLKEDATCYSFFSFTRKLGQTIAGVLATQALVWIGYEGDKAIQSVFTKTQMYSWGALIPAILFAVMFVSLWFFYPLSKKRLETLQHQKAEKLKEIIEKTEN
ncbi:MAG: glycoside-pentoside-hexuronide (GPH):cation symporter [Bacillota bacterium]|jgi:GPH family glycoside/pentoside/hexuronide:cation symporter|nr:glycoside-pentoside-hexuronide (GPH):cation symporter [Bacillota bacterium]HHU43679.1 MFS transporter [Clostridiales bacterium]